MKYINIHTHHAQDASWYIVSTIFSSVQLLSRVWLFATPWIAACQASLSITNSRSLLKLIAYYGYYFTNRKIKKFP